MNILRKFISYYKPYRLLFYTDLFCAIIVSAIDLAFPQILRHLTNNLFAGESSAILRALPVLGISLLAMYIIKYFCQYFIISWGHIMGSKMETDMRRDLFSHFQRLSFSYYDKHNTGELLSTIAADLFDISELAHHGPENIFISFIKIVGAFILLMLINVPLTLILMGVTAVIVVFTIIKNLRMRAVFMDNRKKIATVNARVQDSLAGIRVVQSFANEAIEEHKFKQGNEQFLESKKSSYLAMGSFHAWNTLFQGFLYIAILVFGGISVANGTILPGDLAVYALYINIFLNPIEVLINFTEQLQRGFAGFKRFLNIVETAPEITDKPGATPLPDARGDITFEDVSFAYEGEEDVLSHINISMAAGQNVALVGPSGGGKTTLCSLLPRFYDVTSGRITIGGTDIRDVTLSSLRSAIGIVQQDVYLFGGSIRENIAYGRPDATEEEIIEAAKSANIHDFVASLEQGYDTYVGERGVRLSGGQKQRISIARVFLKNPPILILDEATSALDNESERYIQKSLERLAQNRTTIVIAHRLSTIKNADEIIVIDGDGIRERGNHRILMEQGGLYANYYSMQFEGLEEDYTEL